MEVDDILNSMIAALKGELSEGYDTISAFAERQGRFLAKRAARLANERADGYLKDDDDFFDYLIGNLQRDSASLAQNITNLTILTIEKAWNAVATALWGGIRAIMTAAGVPAGLIPETPPAPGP